MLSLSKHTPIPKIPVQTTTPEKQPPPQPYSGNLFTEKYFHISQSSIAAT